MLSKNTLTMGLDTIVEENEQIAMKPLTVVNIEKSPASEYIDMACCSDEELDCHIKDDNYPCISEEGRYTTDQPEPMRDTGQAEPDPKLETTLNLIEETEDRSTAQTGNQHHHVFDKLNSDSSGDDIDGGIYRLRSHTAPNLNTLFRPDRQKRRQMPPSSQGWFQRSYKKVHGIFLGTQLSTSYDAPDGRFRPEDIQKKPRLLRYVLKFACSKPSKYRSLKAALGFLSGLLFVTSLFVLFYFSRYLFEKREEVESPDNWNYIVGALFAFLLAVGLTLSVAIRCIIVLMIPALFTTRGRGVLFAIILQLLITGPVQNMTENAKLISESTNCQIELLSNQTSEVLEFLVNRTTQLSDQYRNSFNRIVVNNLNTLRDALELRHNILRQVGVVNVEHLGIKFHNITFYINDFKNYSNRVNFSKFYESPQINSSKSVKVLFDELKTDFNDKIRGLQEFLEIAGKVLPWSVLLVFMQSLFYRRAYTSRIEHDNVYVTSNFKNLDKKRKKEKKQYLMPLKMREKSNLVDSTSCLLSRRELSSFSFAMFLVLIFILIGSFVIVIDYGLSSLLTLIRTHGDTILFYRGGAGFTALLPKDTVSPNIRKLLLDELPQVFDENSTRLSYEASTDIGRCLPIARPPFINDNTKVVVLAILYVLVFCFSLLQAYGLRLQHKVAAYFYPEQEVKRNIYLYHSIRAQRVSIKNLLFKKIKQTFSKRSKSTEDDFVPTLSMLFSLRFPRLKRFLVTIGVFKKIDCAACGSEIFSGGQKFSDNVYSCDVCIKQVKTNSQMTP